MATVVATRGLNALLVGCDFSSAPSRQKPIVLAFGAQSGGRVVLSHVVRLASLDAFADWSQQPGPWLGVFDLPFGLPRELVETLGWPTHWLDCMAHYQSLGRDQIRWAFSAFCKARPVGGKFAHRATDTPAGASSSMKWVNPPVAFMLHAGVPLLLQAGVTMPGLYPGAGGGEATVVQSQRVALEGYPGLLAREVLGQRSYKSDDKARQTADRLIARKDLITALEQGQTRLDVRLKLTHTQRDALADDARGDALDAVLCLLQAAWAQRQFEAGDSRYGLPDKIDPLEGWIITA